ncbi:hypothetical protein GCM10010123_37270 [Pilimelia anulata]|uniref:HTH cro/C1-type domain-containing protein n=1 Tax=Pilimelia anulata TaxID=53371 RepID=A0A8J3BCF8_9ACTN|nr:helix-turn-helix domain-containing protein [Pilimelia anulata]GGK03858.1 hypothetical protein GCM10010123_37270 [Pilimelia anulata]
MTHDPLRLPTLTTGQRIKVYRTRRGMTRPVLAGLVSRSVEWVKSVETGKIHPPRLGMLNQIAKTLNVPVTELLDADQQPSANLSGPRQPDLDRVRDALNPIEPIEPIPLAALRAELDAAWRVRDTDPNHRSAIGPRAARLLAVAHACVRAQETRSDRMRAYALMVEACGLGQNFAAFQSGAADVLWRLVERNLIAGHDGGSRTALGVSARWASIAHREAGSWDAAHALLDRTIDELERNADDADHAFLAALGALHSEKAVTFARAGETGRSLRHLDLVTAVAARLPHGYFYAPISFGRSDVRVSAVQIEVELRQPNGALRAAARAERDGAVPSRPRWARHHVDVARAHQLRGEYDEMARALRAAHRISPQSVVYSPIARKLGMDLLETRGQRELAREVAVLAGLTDTAG